MKDPTEPNILRIYCYLGVIQRQELYLVLEAGRGWYFICHKIEKYIRVRVLVMPYLHRSREVWQQERRIKSFTSA